MDQLLKEIEVAKNIENKLILIIGSPGSGKSKLIHEYSDYCCLLYTSNKKMIIPELLFCLFALPVQIFLFHLYYLFLKLLLLVYKVL